MLVAAMASSSSMFTPSVGMNLLSSSRSAHFADSAALRRAAPQAAGPVMPTRMALNRDSKEATLEKMTSVFEASTLVAGLEYKGFTVAQLQKFRRSLPEGTEVIVCKNTLVRKAAEASGNDSISPLLKGQNAWMFVRNEDQLVPSIKAYRALQKEMKLQSDFVGGVMEKRVLSPEDLKTLEKLPTKIELIAKIAGAIKAVPTKVAVAVKGVPRKVAYAAKAIADKDNDAGDA